MVDGSAILGFYVGIIVKSFYKIRIHAMGLPEIIYKIINLQRESDRERERERETERQREIDGAGTGQLHVHLVVAGA